MEKRFKFGGGSIKFKKLGLCLLLICIIGFTVNIVSADSTSEYSGSISNETFNVLSNFTLDNNPTEQEWYNENEFEGKLLREGSDFGEYGILPYDPYKIGIQKENVSKKEAEKFLLRYLPTDYKVSSVKFNEKLTHIYHYESDVTGYVGDDDYGEPLYDYLEKGYLYIDGNLYWYVGGSNINPWLEY